MEDETSEHLEHAEHAEHAAHSGDPFLSTVSVTIAILAVVAATVGSLETVESGAAISQKNAAVLSQNKATDAWNFFQAKSLKKNLYDIAGAQLPAKAEDYARQSKRYDDESGEAMRAAQELEHASAEHLDESEHREHRHHVLTIGVTFLHVAIAVATISIITRGKRWPWYTSMALGVVGVATAAYAYV